MTNEPEPDYCIECGDEFDSAEDRYWGFCSTQCYDEYEDSFEEDGDYV